jgi:hypothetical protein
MFCRLQISSRSMLVTGAPYWWTISRSSRTIEGTVKLSPLRREGSVGTEFKLRQQPR